MSIEEQNEALKIEGQLINLVLNNPRLLAKILSNDKSFEVLSTRTDFLGKVCSSDAAINLISESKELLERLLERDRVFSSILSNDEIRNGILSNDLLISSLRKRTDIQAKIVKELGFIDSGEGVNSLSTIDSVSFYQSVFFYFWSGICRYFDLPYNLSKRDELLESIRNINSFKDAVKAAIEYDNGAIGIFKSAIQVPDENSAITLFEEIFLTQDYKFDCQDKKPVIVDLGAHAGLSVIYFKDQYPDSSIVAVEASPENYNSLVKNLENYGVEGVELHHKAISDSSEPLDFYISLTDSMANTSTKRRLNLNDQCEKISVEGITLDELCKEMDKIDFLKIDVEGSELDVLKGGNETLEKVKQMFVEYHGGGLKEGNELSKILSILDQHQFKYHIADAVSSSLREPFVNKSSEEAFSLKIFAVRKGE